ncbi:SDR family NAD(P)-dependent oxidoreductase [Myceligenerans xiligouense]|uniref:NAD(P)-dependent dehydrogenase (Short-subunit alcohol dehydrogenase family) n=1 Tax=Myceligenerans xiligouense TaxID=253184 RepID=A0A3N4YTC3_9MICO|nr:SDR family oxidoreductase [Myceligenerans xiligouense]RPF21830.1 NAD(P)-dependent dehydrogenase (short-subunit alcohol dehydrogenase family) [Myceligenerans xiligouense]
MNFDGTVALVTGAAHGIGAATARRLHGEGATVVVTDHDADAAAGLARDLGARALGIACDVHDRGSVDAAVDAARAAFGRLDVLVTVAGGSVPTPDPEQVSDEEWARLVDLNLTGTMRCVRAALPLLHESPRPAVVMVSSVNGLAAFGDEPYSAAKAGLSVVAKNYAVRYGPAGIRFNVVAPGTVRTRVWDGQDGALERLAPHYPLGRVGEPEDIAAAIAFLASGDAAWITGVTLPVDGGILAGPLRSMFPER